jgi:hypothetical protein
MAAEMDRERTGLILPRPGSPANVIISNGSTFAPDAVCGLVVTGPRREGSRRSFLSERDLMTWSPRFPGLVDLARKYMRELYRALAHGDPVPRRIRSEHPRLRDLTHS